MELSLHVRTDDPPPYREAAFFIHLETDPAGSINVTRDSGNKGARPLATTETMELSLHVRKDDPLLTPARPPSTSTWRRTRRGAAT